MKVALIYPTISVKERYGRDIGDIGGKQAPLGILYLSSYLKQHNHNVQVIDAEALLLSDEAIIGLLEDFNPDVVAISTTTVAFLNSANLAKKISVSLPKSIIIAGGPHITANPKESIETGVFDFVIQKEGEESFLELIKVIESEDFKVEREGIILEESMTILRERVLPKAFFDVKGIIFYSNNSIIITEEREYIQDIDKLPFPDRVALFDITCYRPPIGCYLEKFSVSMITSRGCPYRCVFCDNNTFGRKIRWFSPKYVVDEIEFILTKYGAREISFVDDTFPSNRKRFIEILKLIEERKLKFVWNCMANVNDLDPELLKLMKAAGCWQIAVGIESGDDEILKLIKKGITVEKVREVVEAGDQAGIMMKGFFMFGHPGETKESLQKTLQFALELPLTDVTCTINTPIKGTELYSMAISGNYGAFDVDAGNSRLNYWDTVFIPNGLTSDYLYTAQREFFKKFYMRRKILFKQLKKIKNVTVLARFLSTVIKLIFKS